MILIFKLITIILFLLLAFDVFGVKSTLILIDTIGYFYYYYYYYLNHHHKKQHHKKQQQKVTTLTTTTVIK